MYKGATTSSFSTCSFFRPASGRRLASRASSSLSKTLSLAHSSPISSPLSSTLFKFSRRQIGSSAAAWRYGGSWRLPVSCRARISRSSAAATECFERKMSTMAGENYFKDILRTLPKPVAEILGDITVYLRSMIRELKYKADGHDTIILAGAEYGSGSSRDWVAKGPMLLGVKAVIAKSFERIHRSNLVGMGIIPLCFNAGEDAESLGLTGFERCTIDLPSNIHDIRPGQDVTVSTDNGKSFTCIVRFDTEVELAYFHHGGILQYVIRSLISPQQ